MRRTGNNNSKWDKILNGKDGRHLSLVVINNFRDNNGYINVGGQSNCALPLPLDARGCKETSFRNTFNGDNNGNIVVGNENCSLTSDRNSMLCSRAANGNVCIKTETVLNEELSDGNFTTELGYENNGFMGDNDLLVPSREANAEAGVFANTFHSTFNGVNEGTIVTGEKNKICMRDCHECTQKSHATADEENASSCERNRNFLLHSQMPCSDGKEFRSILMKYRSRTNELHFLRDYGRYELLNEKITELIGKEDVVDKVICLVETSITLSHRKKLVESQRALEEALELIPQSNASVASVLTALCHLELASVNRRDDELDRALRFIDIALQLIQTLPISELNAYVIYERGSILALLASKGTTEDNGLTLDKTSEDHLRQVVSICETPNVKQGLYVRKHIFALCKLAIRKLKCESTDDHNNTVTDVCIRDAWNSIKTVAKIHKHQTPPAAQIQLKIAESDYYYRIGRYKKSKKCSSDAMIMANKLLMKLELSRIQRRLDTINGCLQREVLRHSEHF